MIKFRSVLDRYESSELNQIDAAAFGHGKQNLAMMFAALNLLAEPRRVCRRL
jgi:hypothetical protein